MAWPLNLPYGKTMSINVNNVPGDNSRNRTISQGAETKFPARQSLLSLITGITCTCSRPTVVQRTRHNTYTALQASEQLNNDRTKTQCARYCSLRLNHLDSEMRYSASYEKF